jgi:hypothetical protein
MENPLARVYYAIDDRCWDILEWFNDRGIPLADFFDDNSLPAVLFLVAVFLVILLSFWSIDPTIGGILPPEARTTVGCGDGTCSVKEDCKTCSLDCGRCGPARDGAVGPLGDQMVGVTVVLKGDVEKITTVSLFGDEGRLLARKEGHGTKYQFAISKVSEAYASAVNSFGRVVESDPKTLNKPENTIFLTLPADFYTFEREYGDLVLTIRDADSGELLDANVSIMAKGAIKKGREFVEGRGSFNLRANTWYYLIVMKPGYEVYLGNEEMIFIEPLRTVQREVLLHKAKSIAGSTMGGVRVCLKGVDANGDWLAALFYADGSGLLDLPPSSFKNGCFALGIDGGSQIYASFKKAPFGCAPLHSDTVLVEVDKNYTLEIGASCVSLAKLRAIVYGTDDVVLTKQVSIALWYKGGKRILGSGPDGALRATGDYTEYVNVTSGAPVYAVVSNSPPGYTDATSGAMVLGEGEMGDLIVRLAPSGLGLIIDGVSMPGSVAQGSEVTVRIDNITAKDGSRTSPNELSVVCETSWGSDVTAEYDDGWSCVLTAPSAGYHTVVVRASHPRLGAAYRSLNLEVVESSSDSLIITRLPADAYASLPTLNFTITLDSEPVDSLETSNVEVYYIGQYKDEFITNGSLVEDDGGWSVTFPVPFKGTYRAEVTAGSLVDNQLHSGSLSTTFRVAVVGDTFLRGRVSPRILAPSGAFSARAELEFLGQDMPDQTVFVGVSSERTYLTWNPDRVGYESTVFGPSGEGAYLVDFVVAEDIGIKNDEEQVIYVIGEPLPTSPCPDICATIEDVRACEDAYQDGLIDLQRRLDCADNGMRPTNCDLDGICDPDEGCSCSDCIGKTDGCGLGMSCQNGVCEPCDYNGDCQGPEDTTNCPDCLIVGPCDLPGDFNGNGRQDPDDLAILRYIIIQLQETGEPYAGPWSCPDINGDGYVTEHDVICLDDVLSDDSVYKTPDGCLDCIKESEYEYCHDDHDNNCDGQTDRETYVGGATPDLCNCSSATLCGMRMGVIYGLPALESCINASWGSGEYLWMEIPECESYYRCESYECEGQVYVCDRGFAGLWEWQPSTDKHVFTRSGYRNLCSTGSLPSATPADNINSYRLNLSRVDNIAYVTVWGRGASVDVQLVVDLYLGSSRVASAGPETLPRTTGKNCVSSGDCFATLDIIPDKNADSIVVRSSGGSFNLDAIVYQTT